MKLNNIYSPPGGVEKVEKMKVKYNKMKTRYLIIMAALLATACGKNKDVADAFGNFEATEIIVSAETNGKILIFDATEGSEVEKGKIIALIDTAILDLQKEEINAGMRSVRTRINSINAQNEIINQQIENLEVNIARIENMLQEGAATQKQYDDLKGQIAVLQKQITANNTQKTSIAAELAVFESRKATLEEQFKRSFVLSPLDGTIIEKYSEAGELTAAGKPLVKIADLSTVKLKVYVSGAQLADIKTGAECTVRIDDGKKGYMSFPGKISHISDKAEFTPKIIQTKEERVTLVYAVTIEVKNDGTMKSGMPGEAIF